MIIPYKVKNPPKSFPVATVTIIAMNTLVFALTSYAFLVVRPEVVQNWALRWGETPPITILTAAFLHVSLFHLLGNMLFLWVFGPAVEDRLGVPLYVGLYLLTGFAGVVAHVALGSAGAIGASVPLLGASGCVMGVLGAYWYMYSWSPVCIFYWVMLVRIGTFELAAMWVIAAYFVMDLASGIFYRSMGSGGGVANFAHVGGALTGALLVCALGIKRDSSDVAKVKAAQAECKDADLLSCTEMWVLVQSSPDDEDLVVRYALKAEGESNAIELKHAITANPRAIIDRCPEVVTNYLTLMNGDPKTLSAVDLLYLGKRMEPQGGHGNALRIYEMLLASYPEAPENQAALYRTAALAWHRVGNPSMARQALDSLLSRYPNGPFTLEAEDLRDEISLAA